MKKLILMGAFVLLSSTIFSCTADEYDATSKTSRVNKVKNEAKPSYADGPGDQTIPVPPPKKPD